MPGYLNGRGEREEACLPSGTGPLYVVSTLALMDFEDRSKRTRLVATQPGVTVDQVVAETGFELIIPHEVGVSEAPTALPHPPPTGGKIPNSSPSARAWSGPATMPLTKTILISSSGKPSC